MSIVESDEWSMKFQHETDWWTIRQFFILFVYQQKLQANRLIGWQNCNLCQPKDMTKYSDFLIFHVKYMYAW